MQEPVLIDIDTLVAQRILVIAPHPDDEALGCGGLIACLAEAGRRFNVVFVTDGGASHSGSQAWSRERLMVQRETEAAQALEILGIGDCDRSFLRLPDAAMPALASPERRAALAAMHEIVRSFVPDLVLLPWRRDPHCDHRDAWTLIQEAFLAESSHPQTLEYAVWLDEIGAPEDRPREDEAKPVGFDISAVLAIKRAAVMAHVSQTTDLIDDDPDAFRLSPATIERLTGPVETYWRPLS